MRAFSLPSRLVLFVSAAILPLALTCGLALTALHRQQQAQVEQSTLGLARALATAVDSELRVSVTALQALAAMEPLQAMDEGDMGAAYALAKAVRASRPEWRGVLLIRPDGELLFGSERPLGVQGGGVVEPDSLAEVLRTQEPAVGRLARGPAGTLAFTVRVPVMREGVLRYVLTAIVMPDAINRVFARQRVPDGWVVSVFDGANRRVASSRGPKFVGTAPSESLQALLTRTEGRRDAVGASLTIDGAPVQSAIARVEWARWTVTLGAPLAATSRFVLDSIYAYGGGLLVSLILGSLAAWGLSRSITRPMARLRDEATALGRGESVARHESGVAEIDAVSHALVDAAATRSRGEAEREQLLGAERVARDAAEKAEHRLQQLVSASARLSLSLEEESTLAAIASVIVPEVADICRIDLLDADGVLQRKLTYHADPRRAQQIIDAVSTRVAPADTPGSFPWAIATGKTFLHNIEDPEVNQIAEPQMREFVRTFGICGACVVPLVARGRTIGAMAALQSESGRRFSAEDGALVGELAQRAAMALDNVRLFAEAKAALAEAKVANRAKDEFLAMLGHELRNPLSPIVTALELMSRRDSTVFPRERQIIERQVRHLARMVDDLLDVSRIISGKIHLNMEPLDLRDVIHRSLELTLPALQQREAMPWVSVPDRPVLVKGDPLRLAQVVCNLLQNAAKFTPRDRRIGIALEPAGGRALLSVSDEGMGIPEALLPHVFERFVQGEQALQRASGGLGLGLPIAQSLARLHGGLIRAESEVGKGSRFTVELPIIEEAASAIAPEAPASARATRAIRLLLVDDNLDAADALAQFLTLEGHEVRIAGSAEEALDLLRQDVPEAAILDIGLPGMNGYELAQSLRAEERTRAMVLLALTGYGRDPDRRQAMDAGFDDHFVKPVQLDALLRRLQQLLQPAP